MAFIRVKNIGNKKTGKSYQYAYIVANKWHKHKVKQKVKKYLGRVHEFPRQECDFARFIGSGMNEYIEQHSAEDIIIDLVRWELANHGFTQSGKFLVNNGLIFDPLKKKLVNKNNKDSVVSCNDGLVSGYLLKRLLRLDYTGDSEEVMYKFAKDFVELGIKVPKEVFIGLYQKVF